MSRAPWLLLYDSPAPGDWNMALDEALLEAAGNGLRALRLYAWDPPALSLGRNEPALRRYNKEEVVRRGLFVVRRPTGGRAVWHERELTYSVAAPADTFGSLPDTYREIHAMLAEALAGLGALVELAAARGTAAVSAGACFQSPAGGEVVTRGGAKIVGSAQVRVGGAFLQHGSVLLFPGQDVVASLTRGNAAAPHDAGLAQLAPGRAGWEDVAEAVARSARRRWRVPATPAEAPAAVLARAGQLRRRYADDAWTWRR